MVLSLTWNTKLVTRDLGEVGLRSPISHTITMLTKHSMRNMSPAAQEMRRDTPSVPKMYPLADRLRLQRSSSVVQWAAVGASKKKVGGIQGGCRSRESRRTRGVSRLFPISEWSEHLF